MSISRRALLFGLAVTALGGGFVVAHRTGFSEAAGSEAELSADKALEMARSGDLLIVDVRTPGEWHQTGIPEGALPVPIAHPSGDEGFVTDVKAAIEGTDRPVALICARGGRSTRALNLLREAGFDHVFNIREGMLGSAAGPGWLARDLPVDRSCAKC